jgi:DNA-directed RNA polymerase specialized sigma24 family protein
MESLVKTDEQSYLESAIKAARIRALTLRRTLRLSFEETQDVRQDLLVKLLEEKKQFDVSRGGVDTFIGVVAHRAAIKLAHKLIREKSHLEFLPPNGVAANDECFFPTIERLLDELVINTPEVLQPARLAEVLHDLNLAINQMSVDQRNFLELLATHQDVPAACKASGLTTPTFYRRLNNLRRHFCTYGLSL